MTERQTMIYKTLLRKIKIEQHELDKNENRKLSEDVQNNDTMMNYRCLT
jgi:hypothetical protein